MTKVMIGRKGFKYLPKAIYLTKIGFIMKNIIFDEACLGACGICLLVFKRFCKGKLVYF